VLGFRGGGKTGTLCPRETWIASTLPRDPQAHRSKKASPILAQEMGISPREGNCAMSVKLMGQVFELDLPTDPKFVLLAMADPAADDGSNSYLAVETIAKKNEHVRARYSANSPTSSYGKVR
jgi:hypothetical protein